MRTIVGVDALARAGIDASAVTIGTFDGVHIGHRALIARAVEHARRAEITSIAITWDRHPNEILRPEHLPPLLSSQERKVELLGETEIDVLVVLPFDEELSHWPPERFVEDVLVKGAQARMVVVGDGWRFGHKAKGDVALLERLGADHAFDAEALRLIEVEGEPVSSSRVRAAIGEGDLVQANLLLTRPFDVDGVVVHGDDRGASLGFPTANIAVDPRLAHPARGVYAGRARVGDSWHRAAINLGVNPTFGGDPKVHPLRIETYVLDFSADLYGQTLRIEFHHRLRDELKFESAAALIDQMARDVEKTRELIQ